MKQAIRLLLFACLGLLVVACGGQAASVETEPLTSAAEPTATLSLPPTATAAPPADLSGLPEPYSQVGTNGQIQFLNSYATW